MGWAIGLLILLLLYYLPLILQLDSLAQVWSTFWLRRKLRRRRDKIRLLLPAPEVAPRAELPRRSYLQQNVKVYGGSSPKGVLVWGSGSV